MVRKKVEGNEQQRRAAAREARREGQAPSAQEVTTGASKQRSHLPRSRPHEEKAAAAGKGKQQWPGWAGDVAPGGGPERAFAGQAGYSDAHEQVFRALTQAQEEHGGEAVYLDEVARGSGMPRDRVRALLHDLARVHRLVTVLEHADAPDRGPRYEVKPRL
jgi:hypothetical protein